MIGNAIHGSMDGCLYWRRANRSTRETGDNSLNIIYLSFPRVYFGYLQDKLISNVKIYDILNVHCISPDIREI